MRPANYDPPLLWRDAVPESFELEYPKGSLVGIGGPVGAGKTTFLNKLDGGERISLDKYREKVQEEMGFKPYEYHVECWPEAFKRAVKRLKACLKEGKTVFIDATHLSEGSIDTMRGFAEEAGSEFHCIYLNATLEECLAAMEARPCPIPQNQVASYHQLMQVLISELEADPYYLQKQGVASTVILDRNSSRGFQGVVLG